MVSKNSKLILWGTGALAAMVLLLRGNRGRPKQGEIFGMGGAAGGKDEQFGTEQGWGGSTPLFPVDSITVENMTPYNQTMIIPDSQFYEMGFRDDGLDNPNADNAGVQGSGEQGFWNTITGGRTGVTILEATGLAAPSAVAKFGSLATQRMVGSSTEAYSNLPKKAYQESVEAIPRGKQMLKSTMVSQSDGFFKGSIKKAGTLGIKSIPLVGIPAGTYADMEIREKGFFEALGANIVGDVVGGGAAVVGAFGGPVGAVGGGIAGQIGGEEAVYYASNQVKKSATNVLFGVVKKPFENAAKQVSSFSLAREGTSKPQSETAKITNEASARKDTVKSGRSRRQQNESNEATDNFLSKILPTQRNNNAIDFLQRVDPSVTYNGRPVGDTNSARERSQGITSRKRTSGRSKGGNTGNRGRLIDIKKNKSGGITEVRYKFD